MSIDIRKAVEWDITHIIKLLRDFAEFENLSEHCQVTEEKLRDAMFGASPCVEGLAAFDRDEPVAYALFYPNFSSFRGQRGIYLDDLYVAPEYRGKGLGEAMLKFLARAARERGAARIDFLVLDWNAPAVKFYEKFGAERNPDERHFRFADAAFENLAS